MSDCTCAIDNSAFRCPHHTQRDFDLADQASERTTATYMDPSDQMVVLLSIPPGFDAPHSIKVPKTRPMDQKFYTIESFIYFRKVEES